MRTRLRRLLKVALALIVGAAVTVLGLFTTKPRIHEIIAPAMAVAITFFFAMMFWRL